MTERDGPHDERFHDVLQTPTDSAGLPSGDRADGLLFVDAEGRLVIAKVSSNDLPLYAAFTVSRLRAVLAVRPALAG